MRESKQFKMAGLMLGLLFVSSSIGLFSTALADDKSTDEFSSESIEHKVNDGDFKSAVRVADTYLREHREDAKAHLLLGRSLFELGKFSQAKVELKGAVKLASSQHLNEIAVAANNLLMKLPKELSAPHQNYSVARIKGRRVAAAGFARPRLLSFYAAWAEPCKQLSADLDKVHTTYGEQLEIVKVDVDDPTNQKMMDQYDISPVPTVVFLDTEGKVTNYFVGYDSPDELNSSVKKALKKD